jgi:hypothetical protein
MTQPRIFLLNPSRVTSLAILALAQALASASPLQAQTYSEIYSFDVTGDPMNPQNTGQITQGRDGNLWSATRVGGSFGVGAAFNVTPSAP